MTFLPTARTAIVFSHPNHELAVFGLVQALKPRLIYLTDGGGEARVAQTRAGLSSIGLLDGAVFLDYTEQSFYDGLLDRDEAFYGEVAERLADALQETDAEQVLCDAVEFYNPVHDMSLPLVRAALHRNGSDAPVFEIPLVHQKPADGEQYEIQRPGTSEAREEFSLRLDDEQLRNKCDARDGIYSILTGQMPIVRDVPPEHLATEVIVKAPDALPAPDERRVLRYEWRAQLLLDRGEIQRMITYRDHFIPLVRSLAEHASSH
jgi:hypothetical protein